MPDPAAQASTPAATRPTQSRGRKAADPPSRSRASRPASKTSARRSPASPPSGASQGPAAASGGRHTYDAAEILENARNVFAEATEPISVSAVVRALGMGDKNERALTAVRQAVLDLVGEKSIVHTGNGRGGHPRYFRARPAKAPQTDAPESTSQPGELVDRIVEVLEVDGGRVSRLDLKAHVGDPDFEEFGFAIERLTAEGKITTTRAGGVAGYELVR